MESQQDGLKRRVTSYLYAQDYADFLAICRREGTNASAKQSEFIKSYVQAHKPGNPQLTMANYVKPQERQPMRVMCLFIKGALSDGRVFCRQAGMWTPGVTCYSCGKNELRKKT